MNPSTALARVLIDALVARGIGEIVISPGSRSAPLALAALEERAPGWDGPLRVHVRIDERSAGFLALGLAKASGRPVAVVTTSGSAVANLHPAVLEAHHAGVPLVFLTADRPPEMRGVGASQTTDQIGFFGSAVRHFHEIGVPRREPGQVAYWRNVVDRAVLTATGALSHDPGPVHLNVALLAPLFPTPGDDGWPDPVPGPRGSSLRSAPLQRDTWSIEPGLRTVVLAGDGAGRRARWLAERGGWPLLAEPSSGARGGPFGIGPYRLMLDRPELGGAIERVILCGNATLSRPVTRLLERRDVEIVVVSGGPSWPDPTRNAALILSNAHPDVEAQFGATPDAWLLGWTAAARAAEHALDDVLRAEPGLTGPAVARTIASSLQPGSLLWAGSSNPVRDLDLAMQPSERFLDVHTEHDGRTSLGAGSREEVDDEAVMVLANRGLAGIDGAVSSAIGAALAHRRGRPSQGPATTAVALLGDLSFLHDATGLVIGPDEPRPDLTIVVVNDDGGGLFHLLEQGAPEHAASFERVFGTPHGVDLAALCAATGTVHVRATTTAELATVLQTPAVGIQVVEVPLTRVDRREQEERLRRAVEVALDGLAGSMP